MRGKLLAGFTLALIAGLNARAQFAAFAPAVNYPAGGSPTSIATADFNRDGTPDVVVVNSASNSFSYLQGTASGTFNSPVTISMSSQTTQNPTGIADADFDKDGFLEIWLNPEGRDLLVRELQSLNPKWDHVHIGWDMEIDAEPVPYRPSDDVMEWGKIYLRPDEWDEKYFPHVMAEKKRN